MVLREVMEIFYAVNAIRKLQNIKPSTGKAYQYLKKLDKNLEKFILNPLWKVLLKLVVLQLKEKQRKNHFFQLNHLKVF